MKDWKVSHVTARSFAVEVGWTGWKFFIPNDQE